MVRLLLLLLFPSVLSAQVSSTVPMGTSHTHTIVSGPSTTLTAVIAAAGAHPQTVSIYGALPVGSGGTVPATLDVDLTAGTITNTGGGIGAGIYVQAARMLVESNVYARVNGHTDAAGYCFRVQDVSTPDTDANIFRGNTCRNAVTKDFSIETGVTNTVLENDGGASITDAGTNTRRLWFTDVFANLGSFANGSMGSCTDCTVASPCAGSGTGAFAKRQGGAWVCN